MNNHPVCVRPRLGGDSHTHDYFRIKVLSTVKQTVLVLIQKTQGLNKEKTRQKFVFNLTTYKFISMTTNQ